MNFIIARHINKDYYIMCNSSGSSKTTILHDDYLRIKDKICEFNDNIIGIIDDNDKLIKNSLTLIGKYYRGKNKDIHYLVCDANLHRVSITKESVIKAYREGKINNIIVTSDNRIRMIKGSVPYLNKLNTLRNKNTVIKIGNIKAGTPGSQGVGKKFLGKRISDSKIGCVKFELFPDSYDINNEVLAYKLGLLLNFDVAEATFECYNNNRCIISMYNYNYPIENIVSLKSEIGTYKFHSKFNKKWFIQNKSDKSWCKFIQLIMLDLIMHQTDRHISNISFIGGELYSSYDNGRALFFDNFEKSTKNINLNSRGSIVDSFYTNEHGYGWMFLEDVLTYDGYKNLIRHDLTYEDFINIVNESYGDANIERNNWVAEYMYKVYLIIIKQEGRWKAW